MRQQCKAKHWAKKLFSPGKQEWYLNCSTSVRISRLYMEYNCHIFSKYLVFQIENLAFQSKYQVFLWKTLDFNRNTRYLKSEILKYQVFHTFNLKYQVFRAKYLVFQKRCEIPGFYWILCVSSSISFRSSLHSAPFVDSFSNSTGESGEVIYKQI